MAWRRPEAPKSAAERAEAYRRGLELQADLYGTSPEGVEALHGGSWRLGDRRRRREDDGLGHGPGFVLDLAEAHPLFLVLLPLAVAAWLLRRVLREPDRGMVGFRDEG